MRETMKKNAGFTLIELMIVVAIIAILASIAYPGYRSYVTKSNRAEAHSALLRAADLQERYYLQNNSYAPNEAVLGVNLTTEHGYYNITVVGAASTYTITAQALGGQLSDVNCLNMTLNQAGQKAPMKPGNPEDCW